MRKGLILLTVVLLLAPLSGMAQHDDDHDMSGPMGGRMGMGHPGPDGDGPGHGRRGGGLQHLLAMGDEIGLTDQQRDQLKQLQLDHKIETIDRRAELKKAQVRLRALMREENADGGEVERAIDEVAGLRADLQKARYAHRKQIHAVLTEEQIDKIKELRQGHFGKAKRMFEEGKRMHRRGRFGRGGGWGRP